MSVHYGDPAQGYNNAAQSATRLQGEKYAQTSLIFGIVGLFLLGIVFGPLAIVNANKAEKLHVAATGGKVLGWIDTILSVLGIVIFLFIMIGAAGASTGS